MSLQLLGIRRLMAPLKEDMKGFHSHTLHASTHISTGVLSHKAPDEFARIRRANSWCAPER